MAAIFPQADHHTAACIGSQDSAVSEIGKNRQIEHQEEDSLPPGGLALQMSLERMVSQQIHHQGGINQSRNHIVVVAIQINAAEQVRIVVFLSAEHQKMKYGKQNGCQTGGDGRKRENPLEQISEAAKIQCDKSTDHQRMGNGKGCDIISHQGINQIPAQCREKRHHHFRENLCRIPVSPYWSRRSNICQICPVVHIIHHQRMYLRKPDVKE